jgi:hypothetical protein
MFSSNPDDSFDRSVAAPTGAVPVWLALLPGLLLIALALFRAF